MWVPPPVFRASFNSTKRQLVHAFKKKLQQKGTADSPLTADHSTSLGKKLPVFKPNPRKQESV